MARIYRQEFLEWRTPIGWPGPNGEIVYDTDDRFNTPYMIENYATPEISYTLHDETVADTGLAWRSLEEIMRLGFTTREYQAMVLYGGLSKGEDHVRSERELTALMSSTVVGHMLDRHRIEAVTNSRAASRRDDPVVEPTGRIRRAEIRRERVRVDNPAGGSGRFGVGYRFCNDDGTESERALTVAETGIMEWKISDLAWWDFSAAEVETMLLFEFASNGNDHVRSEDELNILFPGSAHEIDRTLRLFNFRKSQESAVPQDHRHLHPGTLPDPKEEPWGYWS